MRPSSRFVGDVFMARHAFRMDCVDQRRHYDWSGEQQAYRVAVAEIAALRLQIACNPLFKTLQRIENQLAILGHIRDDPYAPPVDRNGLIRTR